MTGPARVRRLLLPAMASLVAVTSLVAGFAAAAPVGAQGDDREDPSGRVLLVTLPRTTWERLQEADTPNLDRFLDDAAMASMSPRTVGARTTPASAYLTIGAGDRSVGVGPPTDGAVLMANETTPTGSAAELYLRRTGTEPTGDVLAVNFPQVRARNDALLYGADPGALGSALAAAGSPVAVVGNADTDLFTDDGRQVGLAAVDTSGQAFAGEVGKVLLVADPLAPTGVRLDAAAVLAAVDAAWGDTDVVLVEMSDLERAELARSESTPAQGDAEFTAALERADRVFGDLVEDVDTSRDLVVVAAPTSPLEREQLLVFAMSGPDVAPGWARSATTRRTGYVSLTDIAATVLAHRDIEVPSGVSATPATSVASGDTATARAERLVGDNDAAVSRDAAFGTLTVGYIVLLVLMLLWVVVVVATGRRPSALLGVLNLTVMALPGVTYLGGLLPSAGTSAPGQAVVLVAVALVVAAVAWWLGRGEPMVAPLVVAGTTVVLLLADVLTGAHLQIDTVFGYSPIVAGRFAGYGNQAFSMLAISALVVATMGWALSERRGRPSPALRTGVLVAFFVVVVVAVGAPAWGSDVGGVLAAVPAFTVCTLLLLGRRIRVATAAVIALATVGVLAVFAAVDLSRAAEDRTHLGRFVSRLVEGEAWTILERKLNANVGVLTSTAWTWVIPAALAFLAYLTWRPNRGARRIVVEYPAFRTFCISGLTLGLVAWALNDSGVSMPAMMLAIALLFTSHLVLAEQSDGT